MAKLIVLLSAILVGVILFAVNENPISDQLPQLDYTGFDEEIASPVLAGLPLKFFSWLATETPLRPVIVGFLLKQNGFHRIRELASRFGELEPLYYPMYRMSPEEVSEYSKPEQPDTLEEVLAKFKDTSKSSTYRTTLDYNEMYKSGKMTPTEVMRNLIKGCRELEDLKIFSSFKPEFVEEQAEQSTKRWKMGKPLSVFDGVPVVVKDMIEVKGLIMYKGTAVGVPCERDDTIVHRLKKAGAIIVGLTVMTEGGSSPLGYSVLFKGPYNPYNRDYYTGGSSSGCAVAVAAGLAPLSVGFDGGGSIRVPSALSGVFGLATTFGRVPFESGNTVSTMIKAGPLAASTVDTALVYSLISQPPESSHFYAKLYGTSSAFPRPRLDGIFDIKDLTGVRIGIVQQLFDTAIPEKKETIRKTTKFLQSKGASVVNVTIPNLKVLALAHAMKITSEFALSMEDSFANTKNMEPNTRITIALGKTITANDVIAGERLRHWATNFVKEHVFSRADVLLTSTVGIENPKLNPNGMEYGENNNLVTAKVMHNIFLANLLGLPAMSIPVAYGSNGMPDCIQLVADHWMEHKLLRLSHLLEQEVFAWKKPQRYFDPLTS